MPPMSHGPLSDWKNDSNVSEDPGPHAVFFSCVRRAGRGGWDIQGVVVVVVGSKKYLKNNEILIFDGVGHGF